MGGERESRRRNGFGGSRWAWSRLFRGQFSIGGRSQDLIWRTRLGNTDHGAVLVCAWMRSLKGMCTANGSLRLELWRSGDAGEGGGGRMCKISICSGQSGRRGSQFEEG